MQTSIATAIGCQTVGPTTLCIDKSAVTITVLPGSVIILATIAIPGGFAGSAVEAKLASTLSTKQKASALLGITVTTDPSIKGVSPYPPPSPSPPPVCSQICNWSQLKVAPLLGQDSMCAKYQPRSINAPVWLEPTVAGEWDLYDCKQASPGSANGCPGGDYFMCYGNKFYVAPSAASLLCAESLAGNCGTCPNQDRCGKDCQKKEE